MFISRNTLKKALIFCFSFAFGLLTLNSQSLNFGNELLNVISDDQTVVLLGEDSRVITNADYYLINQEAYNEILSMDPDTIFFIFRFEGKDVSLELTRSEVLADGFQAYAMEENGKRNLNLSTGHHYHGKILNQETRNIVAFSFFENSFIGLISSIEEEITVSSLGNNGYSSRSGVHAVAYKESNLVDQIPFVCQVDHDLDDSGPGASSFHGHPPSMNRNSLCFSSYIEIDFEMYSHFGTELNTLNWVVSVYNTVQAVYLAEGIATTLSEVLIWTVEDPYPTGESTRTNLNKFGVSMSFGFKGDLAHLIAYRSSGGEGRAFIYRQGEWSVCHSNPYNRVAFSRVSPNIEDFPTYNRALKVIIHEIGHNLGSRHTHRCVWNGNNTQIDDYGNVFASGNFPDKPEGSACLDSNNLMLNVKPTIMSYFDSYSHGHFSLSNGFGQQPGDQIRTILGGCSNCSFDPCTNDVIPPTFTCPEDRIITDCLGVLQDFREKVTDLDDNCGVDGVTLTQNPAPGLVLTRFTRNALLVTLTAEDQAGNISTCEIEVSLIEVETPVFQNRPNPFEDQTVIEFFLANDTEATLTVFDVTGKIVEQLKGSYMSGYNEILLRDVEGWSDQVYFYRLDTRCFSTTKKMVLLR